MERLEATAAPAIRRGTAVGEAAGHPGSAMDPAGFARGAIRVLSIALVASGIVILGGLEATDLWSQWVAEQRIDELTASLDDLPDEQRIACKRQAGLYNARLSGAQPADKVLPYAEQLRCQNEPMMGYLEIPKIGVKQPICHGSTETELMAGVGHLESSALPVGGKGCRCVLLGHSGMRNARMFDDLELLEAGDVFTLWTLNEPYAYRVFSTEVVKPQEVEARIAPEAGRDLVTLITCTPYGVNSHRLLVHAERCAYGAAAQPGPDMRAPVDRRSAALLAALGLIATAGIALGAKAARRREKTKEEG